MELYLWDKKGYCLRIGGGGSVHSIDIISVLMRKKNASTANEHRRRMEALGHDLMVQARTGEIRLLRVNRYYDLSVATLTEIRFYDIVAPTLGWSKCVVSFEGLKEETNVAKFHLPKTSIKNDPMGIDLVLCRYAVSVAYGDRECRVAL